jgi:hypothetical protein
MSSHRIATFRRPAQWLALVTAAVLGTTFSAASAGAAPQPTERVAHDTTSAAMGSQRPLAGGRSAIYGGGPFYSGGQAVIDTIRSSGFSTVFLWSIHIHPNGDLVYNDTRIVAGGQYVGDPGWSGRLRRLKQSPTSVNRIEVSVGSWGVPDWENIDSLIQAQGTGPSSILYRNFRVLKNITGADAVNDDDESHYDVNSTVAFARMTATLGYKFTIAPYTNASFWASLKNRLGGLDRVYLQVYAGGSGNNPGTWIRQLGMPVDPGLWSRHDSGCSAGDSPARVRQKMAAWHRAHNIPGGFRWLFDDIQRCSSQGSAAAYAAAINDSTGSGRKP